MPDRNSDKCGPSVISARPFAMEPYPDRMIVYLFLIVKRYCQLTSLYKLDCDINLRPKMVLVETKCRRKVSRICQGSREERRRL